MPRLPMAVSSTKVPFPRRAATLGLYCKWTGLFLYLALPVLAQGSFPPAHSMGLLGTAVFKPLTVPQRRHPVDGNYTADDEEGCHGEGGAVELDSAGNPYMMAVKVHAPTGHLAGHQVQSKHARKDENCQT